MNVGLRTHAGGRIDRARVVHFSFDGRSLTNLLHGTTLKVKAVVDGGGIDSDRPGALPALSGGGALGNGRMHGVPQMLECYLQLSRRAGERQRDVTVGVACHSSPLFGGAIAYSSQPV